MALLEGKSPAERNKLIAAAALGLIALVTLYLAFGRSFFGGSTAAKPNASPTPAVKTVSSTTRTDQVMPPASEQDFTYQTTQVVYSGPVSAPDPGRNIFAFYEPPKPCTPGKDCPPPTPKPVIVPTPTPQPPPPITITFVNPQGVYAGQRGFRLEVNGQKIPADAHIYFNQTQLPTTYVNDTRVVTDIPANLVAQEGSRQIILQTPDGKKYSNPLMMNVQAPPTPPYQYVGAILRARHNNDTAVLREQGKTAEFSARLNDVLKDAEGQQRFRVVDISASEVVFEDTKLGFRHRLAINKTQEAPGGGGAPLKGGFPAGTGMPAYDQNNFQKDIPGIPSSIPRYVPPSQPQMQAAPQKKDVDDNDPNN